MSENLIHYIEGDATAPIGDGKKLIVHICNNAGYWGAGFVLALSNKWPITRLKFKEWFNEKLDAVQAYRKYVTTGEKFALGRFQIVEVEPDISVANLLGQSGIRTVKNPKPIKYDAISTGLMHICIFALENNMSVHMPKIGTGLAGGTWVQMEPIIMDRLCSKGVKVYVYTLPGKTTSDPILGPKDPGPASEASTNAL